ncbi:YlbF family regulator [Natrinema gelatinilyticum]|uniref:YlbF family regulator n=1 Tax=Natrinema gelatinilyticum TaxID=2961571 RepID=UPI0020C1D7F3|nr:YlbF family regulator [Natrinema gelatinilyticum]
METDTISGTEQSDVSSLASRLGAAIADMPEYQRFLETQMAVQNSEEAQQKISEFEQAHESYMLSRQSGSVSQDQIQRLQNLQSELNSIPVMAEHLEAQAALEARLTELNDVISEPLSIDFGQKAGGCCED